MTSPKSFLFVLWEKMTSLVKTSFMLYLYINRNKRVAKSILNLRREIKSSGYDSIFNWGNKLPCHKNTSML